MEDLMKLNLLKFKEDDFDYYYKLVSNNRVMSQITERAIPYEEAKINFQKLVTYNKNNNDYGSYKISIDLDQEFIGLAHLTSNEQQTNEAEIGYMILPKYWGRGFGTDVVNQLIEIASQLGLEKIQAIIDPENIASRKILSNQGFIFEVICEIDGLPGEILSKNL